MEESVKRRFLKVLVELDLFPKIKILKETNLTDEEIDCEQLKSIIKFINELAPEYKNLPDRDKIIAQELRKMDIVTQWGEKKIQENEKIKPTNNPNKAIDKENSKER